MSNIDDLLAQVRASTPEAKIVVVPDTSPKQVKKTPWIMVGGVAVIIILVAYLLLNKTNVNPEPINPIDPDPVTPIVSVVTDKVQEMENQYSLYKGECYLKIAELVESGDISNREELKVNTQNLLEKARLATLGELDKLDNQNIPEKDFKEYKDSLVKYLKEKAEGFKRAGK